MRLNAAISCRIGTKSRFRVGHPNAVTSFLDTHFARTVNFGGGRVGGDRHRFSRPELGLGFQHRFVESSDNSSRSRGLVFCHLAADPSETHAEYAAETRRPIMFRTEPSLHMRAAFTARLFWIAAILIVAVADIPVSTHAQSPSAGGTPSTRAMPVSQSNGMAMKLPQIVPVSRQT